MSVASRFKEYIDNQNLRVADVEKETGVSGATLRNIIRRNSSLSSDILAQLVLKYPNLNIYWLLTGNGSMLKTNQTTNCQDCEDKLKLAELVIETQKELIQQLRKNQ